MSFSTALRAVAGPTVTPASVTGVASTSSLASLARGTQVLDKFAQRDISDIRNLSAFVITMLRTVSRRARHAATQDAGHRCAQVPAGEGEVAGEPRAPACLPLRGAPAAAACVWPASLLDGPAAPHPAQHMQSWPAPLRPTVGRERAARRAARAARSTARMARRASRSICGAALPPPSSCDACVARGRACGHLLVCGSVLVRPLARSPSLLSLLLSRALSRVLLAFAPAATVCTLHRRALEASLARAG